MDVGIQPGGANDITKLVIVIELKRTELQAAAYDKRK
jgi:hypothetical protein